MQYHETIAQNFTKFCANNVLVVTDGGSGMSASVDTRMVRHLS